MTNQRSSFQRLEETSRFFTMLTDSHAEGQSSMHIEWISEVYRQNQLRPPGISLETVGTTMVLSKTGDSPSHTGGLPPLSPGHIAHATCGDFSKKLVAILSDTRHNSIKLLSTKIVWCNT